MSTMRIFFQAHLLLILGSVPALNLLAQELPTDVPAWQLVKTFIQKTGSPEKKVDRKEFAKTRLTGEAATLDPESFRGLWKEYIDVYIDTIISLPDQYRKVPGDAEKKIPSRIDTIQRSVLSITTYIAGAYDNLTFFCVQDSIWRIESWRQFPTPEERAAISKEMLSLDTADGSFLTKRSQLTRLLLSEKDLRSLFATLQGDASALTDQLIRSKAWSTIDLHKITNDSVGEYDPLDDGISATDLFIFRLNRSAIARLAENGIAHIHRYRLGDMIFPLYEIGSFGEKSMGFLFVADSSSFPPLEKESFFTLRPVAGRWWFYEGFVREANIASPTPPEGDTGVEEEKPRQTEKRRSQPRGVPQTEQNEKVELLRPKEKEKKPE